MDLFVILAVLNIICMPVILIVAVVKRKLYLLIPSVIIQLVWIITGPEYLTYRAGGGFGPGAFVGIILVLFLVVSVLIFVVGGGIVLFQFRKQKNRIIWYLVYAISAVFLFFLMKWPLPVSRQDNSQCDQLNRQEIEKIVSALDSYRAEYGEYPQDLAVLVPTYLPLLPVPHCFEKYSDLTETKRGFGESVTMGLPRFVICNNSVAIPVITFGWLQMYDLETGEWSRISFLDLPECYDQSLRSR